MSTDYSIRFIPPGEGLAYVDTTSEFHFDIAFSDGKWRLRIDPCWDVRGHTTRCLSPAESEKVLPRLKVFLEQPMGAGALREISVVEFVTQNAKNT
jgi:hypothetical protein